MPDLEIIAESSALAKAPMVPGKAAGIMEIEKPIHIRLDAKLGKVLHDKIMDKLSKRFMISRAHVQKRFDDWDRTDEHLQGYIDLRRGVRKGDRTTDTSGKLEMPWGRSIAIPTMQATLMVRVVQEVGHHTSRDPMFHYQGSGTEDINFAQLIEVMSRYDIDCSGGILLPWQVDYDAERYGVCCVYDTFESEWGKRYSRPRITDREQIKLMRQTLPGAIVDLLVKPQSDYGLIREYYRMLPIDPYMMLPDPRVSLADHQNGEFFGHAGYGLVLGWMMDNMEHGGPYFNINNIVDDSGRSTDGAGRAVPGEFDSHDWIDDEAGFRPYYTMQVKIIPRFWKLGDSEDEEKWVFTVCQDNASAGTGIIIRAHEMQSAHNEFSYAIGQIFPDKHAAWTAGSGELMDGTARIVNFFANAHIQNALKTMHNRYIYDPMLVRRADMESPNAGRNVLPTEEASQLIRAGVLPLSSLVFQVPATDYSMSLMQDVEKHMELGQRLMAANDTQQGSMTQDQRTLGEVQAALQASSKRVEIVAKMIDTMVFRNLAKRLASSRVQWTSQAQWYAVPGNEIAKKLNAEQLFISPDDLVYGAGVNYITHTSMSAPDPSRMAEVWTNLMQSMATAGLFQGQPGGRRARPEWLIEQIAKAFGINYLDKAFEDVPQVPTNVVDDATVQQQVKQGNMIPMNQLAGAKTGAAARGLQQRAA
jgi:hypothetical protein